MEHRKFESLLNFLEVFKDKIDINNKNNGKTLLHNIIIELGRYKNIDLLQQLNGCKKFGNVLSYMQPISCKNIFFQVQRTLD